MKKVFTAMFFALSLIVGFTASAYADKMRSERTDYSCEGRPRCANCDNRIATQIIFYIGDRPVYGITVSCDGVVGEMWFGQQTIGQFPGSTADGGPVTFGPSAETVSPGGSYLHTTPVFRDGQCLGTVTYDGVEGHHAAINLASPNVQ